MSADDDLSIPHGSNEDISIEEGEVEDVQQYVELNIVQSDIGMIELPYIVKVNSRGTTSNTLSADNESLELYAFESKGILNKELVIHIRIKNNVSGTFLPAKHMNKQYPSTSGTDPNYNPTQSILGEYSTICL